MADEDISLTEDQLLENLDDGNNGDAEFEVNIHSNQEKLILFLGYKTKYCRVCE